MSEDTTTYKWGDVVELQYGKSLKKDKRQGGPTRVYGSNGPIGWTDHKPQQTGPCVILGRKGAYRGVEYWDGPVWVIDTAYRVVPKKDTIDMRWLYYAVKAYGLGEIDDGSPIPSTTRAAVYIRDVFIPPLAEQKRIAHILGSFDDKIELNRKMNETLEAMAQALFKDWFVDFGPTRAKMEGKEPYLAPELWELFPDKLGEDGVPEGWGAGVLKDFFKITMGQSPPGHTYNNEGEGMIFYQGRTDFGFRYPSPRRYCIAPNRLAYAEDTLVSVRAPVGDINRALETCCIGRGVAAVRHKSSATTFTYYSLWNLQSQLREYENTGTVFGSINKKQFEQLAFVEPADEILQAFEEQAGAFDNIIRSNHDETSILKSTRDILLKTLFRSINQNR